MNAVALPVEEGQDQPPDTEENAEDRNKGIEKQEPDDIH
jgi:hypothetical protein